MYADVEQKVGFIAVTQMLSFYMKITDPIRFYSIPILDCFVSRHHMVALSMTATFSRASLTA